MCAFDVADIVVFVVAVVVFVLPFIVATAILDCCFVIIDDVGVASILTFVLFVCLFLTSNHQTFSNLFKVRHAIGCINHDL